MREDIKSSITKELNDLKLEITSDNDKILSNFKDKERKKENVSNLWIAATQLKLKELGYEVGKVDGIYGKNTAAATKAFQKNNGLTEDGYAGKDTINKMLTEDVKKANTTDTPITETNKEQKENKEQENNKKEKNEEKKLIGGVEHIIIRPKTIEEIPTPDKRDKTKKKVYEFGEYRFFDNGRAGNLKDKTIHNTTDIIQKLQKQQKLISKEFDKKYHSTIQNNAKKIFQQIGFMYPPIWNNLTAKLSHEKSNIEIDISKYCDNRGNLIELDELKNEIAAQKAKIEKDNKNKAELSKAEDFFKEKTYKADRLFKDNPNIPGSNVAKKDDIQYSSFFKKFTNETISFDKNSKIEGNNLILELDQWGSNEYKNITIPLKELGITSGNFIFGKSISYRQLEDNLRKALAKKIDEIVG
ncbi:peptidoglycan-binding protein [Candidatus Gracilibacteria bacterium]|nr:peptidoglycan-binding protein [Candidatus Gracilibacteria bacterium]